MRRLSTGLYKKAFEDRDKGGISRRPYIDWDKVTGGKGKPKFFQAREGVNKFNIIPYVVTSELHPLVKQRIIKIGDLDFVLDIWVHPGSKLDLDTDLLCPKKNYAKPCPLCEQNKKLHEEGKKEEAKAFNPSRRTLFNLQPLVQGEVQELQVFNVSHYLFAKELFEEANACTDGKDIIPYADIENGRVIKCRMAIEQNGKFKQEEFKAFDFLPREEALDDKLIDQALSFDKGLILLPYEEIEKIMYGQDSTPTPQETSPGPASAGSPAEEKKEAPVSTPEPASKTPSAPTGNNPCPAGHIFGKDEGKYPKDCKKCPKEVWDKCVDA